MTMRIPVRTKQEPKKILHKVPELRLYISHSYIWLGLSYGFSSSWFSSSPFLLSLKPSMFWIQPAAGEPVIELGWLFWKVDSLVIIFNRNEIVFQSVLSNVMKQQCTTSHGICQHTSLTANLIGYNGSGLKDNVLKFCAISLLAWPQCLSAFIEN